MKPYVSKNQSIDCILGETGQRIKSVSVFCYNVYLIPDAIKSPAHCGLFSIIVSLCTKYANV